MADIDTARDEWPALRWRPGRHRLARLVGVGHYGGRRIRVVVWADNRDVSAYGEVTPILWPVGTVSGLPLRAALRELRRRLA